MLGGICLDVGYFEVGVFDWSIVGVMLIVNDVCLVLCYCDVFVYCCGELLKIVFLKV